MAHTFANLLVHATFSTKDRIAALRGDAGIRALTAWHFGWAPAREACGTAWMPAYLSHLLDDPYDVVRYIAGRSLKRIGGYENLPFDFVSPRSQRLAARQQASSRWRTRGEATEHAGSARLLIDAEGELMQREFTRIAGERDDKPMILDE